MILITLPPEIIDGLIALGSAFLGWLARLLATKKKVTEIKEQNSKLKEVVGHYDLAARNALKHSRKFPRPLNSPGTVGEEKTDNE